MCEIFEIGVIQYTLISAMTCNGTRRFDLASGIMDIDPFLPLNPASVQKVFPSLTKIVGTLGPKSHSVEVIQECLTAGMSGYSLITTLFVSGFICIEAYFDIAGYCYVNN